MLPRQRRAAVQKGKSLPANPLAPGDTSAGTQGSALGAVHTHLGTLLNEALDLHWLHLGLFNLLSFSPTIAAHQYSATNTKTLPLPWKQALTKEKHLNLVQQKPERQLCTLTFHFMSVHI